MLLLVKLINLLPAAIGITQSLLPLIKDVVVAVIRLLDVIGAVFGKDIGVKWIKAVNIIYDSVYEGIEEAKNSLVDREELKANGIR